MRGGNSKVVRSVLTSKGIIDVDGAEYSFRRPVYSEVGELNASLLDGLDSGPLSIHRLKLYWAGRASSFVRWHGGIGDGRSERIANKTTRDGEERSEAKAGEARVVSPRTA
jgi:hypothetical protein